LYIGMFMAPSVLFFALTGALQIFSLHEAHGEYVPPPLVEKLSSVHKDQVFKARPHATEPALTATKAPPKGEEHRTPAKTLLLKAFFLFIALGLTMSTVLGLWIGLTHPRDRRLSWILFAAGAVMPVALILI
jgi:hypothetical protein